MKAKRDLPRHGDPKGCPAMDCAGGTSGRQRALTPELRIEIEKEAAPGSDASLSGAQICGYCGCVYQSGQTLHDQAVRLGYWNNHLLGPGWKPRKKSSSYY